MKMLKHLLEIVGDYDERYSHRIGGLQQYERHKSKYREFITSSSSLDDVTADWLMRYDYAPDIALMIPNIQKDINQDPNALWDEYRNKINQLVKNDDPDNGRYEHRNAALRAYAADENLLSNALYDGPAVKLSALKRHFDRGLELLSSEAIRYAEWGE